MNTRKNMALAVLLAFAPAAAADTIQVTQYQADLQAVIDAAQPGDVIQLEPGTWLGSLHIPAGKDGLTLAGPAMLVNGGRPGAQALLTIDADHVTVRGVYTRGDVQGPAIGILARGGDVRLIDVIVADVQGDAVVLMGAGASVQGSTFQAVAGAAVTLATLGSAFDPPVCTWGGLNVYDILDGQVFGGWLTGEAGNAGVVRLIDNDFIDVGAAVRVIGDVEASLELDGNAVATAAPVLVVDAAPRYLQVHVRDRQQGAAWLLKAASGETVQILGRGDGFMLNYAPGSVSLYGVGQALPGNKPTGTAPKVKAPTAKLPTFEGDTPTTDQAAPDVLLLGRGSGAMQGYAQGAVMLYGMGQALAGTPPAGGAPKVKAPSANFGDVPTDAKLTDIAIGTQGKGLLGQAP